MTKENGTLGLGKIYLKPVKWTATVIRERKIPVECLSEATAAREFKEKLEPKEKIASVQTSLL